VSISGTLAGLWTTRVDQLWPILERIGRAINDKMQGQADGEYAITSEQGQTVDEIIDKIFRERM
jgi:hypothetical protein